MLKNPLRYFYLGIFALVLIFSHDGFAQKRKKKDKSKDQIEKADTAFQSGNKNDEAEFFFIEAMKHFMLEDYEKALKYFEKVIELKPEVAAAHFKIADIYLIQGNTKAALPHAKKALELDNQNKSYYLLIARIYEFQQDFQKAANVLQNLLQNIKGAEEHLFDLALIQTFLEDYEGALESYQKVEDYFGVSPEIVQQKQRLLLRINRLDEAIAEGDKLIENFPNEKELVYDQIKLLMSNDRKTEAKRIIYKLLNDDPDNPEAMILMSDIFRAEDKIDSANMMINKAFVNPKLDVESKLAIISNLLRFAFNEKDKSGIMDLTETLSTSYPNESRVQAFMGDILLNYQEKEKALNAYKKAIKLDDSDLLIWTNIVLLHFEFEEYDSVIKYSSAALEIFPNQGRLWFMEGLGYYSKSDFSGAKGSLETALKYVLEENAMRSDILSTLGDTYNNLEEYSNSDKMYEEALSINPFNEHVLNNYSYFLSLRNENLNKALEMCEKLMISHDDNPTYLDTYAWVLYKLERYEDALKAIEKAIDGTSSGVIYEHYGDILYKLERKDEAMAAWNKAGEFEDASDLIQKKLRDQKLYE